MASATGLADRGRALDVAPERPRPPKAGPTSEGEHHGACALPYPKNSFQAEVVAPAPSSTLRQPDMLQSHAGGLLEDPPPSSNFDYRDMALDWYATVRASRHERREGLEFQAKPGVAETNQRRLYNLASPHPPSLPSATRAMPASCTACRAPKWTTLPLRLLKLASTRLPIMPAWTHPCAP